ncbi:MAG TPA: TonB-dependent receptor [Novosphingobium sp.]|nr:TonB-dependent receptor [Novosphingobium sp.]
MLRYSTVPFALLAVPAIAQEVPAPALQAEAEAPEVDEGGTEILVVAERVKGQVDAPQAPIATFDETEIGALGASSLTDVLSRISPQTGSGRGRGGGMPVVLVNGQRITNFREMRNFPPEALRRVEVLPEEVALRYGFPANARVVNLILKDKFASRRIEAEYRLPTRGGFNSWELEASQMRIDGPSRFNVTASIEDGSPLFESERPGLISASNLPSVAGDPDPRAFRSLIADTRDIGVNASWTKGLGKDGTGGAISLNANASRSDSLSWSGLDLARLADAGGATALRALADPLERRGQTTSLQGGAGLNLFPGRWQLSATLDAGHTVNTTRIDRRADTSGLIAAALAGSLPISGPLPALPSAGFDTARSESNTATALVTMIGRPLLLPAGEVAATFKAGYAFSAIDSSDTRSTAGPVSLRRGDLSAGVNLGIPIASRRENSLAALGDLTLNFSAGYNHLSDFGSLTDWSAGLTWSPVEKLNLQASYLVNEAAPSLSQLGSPANVTFNVPVYDFARGETVLVTVTGGGNPALRKESQRDLKLGANYELPMRGSSLLVEYFRNRSDDVSASFPLLTPAIEAAFPGRAVRDASGRLTGIDQRPVTLAEQTGSRLRWGLNLSGTIGKAPEGGSGMMGMMGGGRGPGGPRGGSGRPAGAGAGGGRGPGGGMMGAMFGGGGQGRWNVGVYHTVQFSSRVLIAPGGPALDLLDGDALSGGGTPRHSVEFNLGAFHKGLGMFGQGTWSGPTTLKASGAPGTSDLRFGSLAKVNLSVFADLGQVGLAKQAPFFKGARVSLRVDNLFDARQKVKDGSGMVPLSYQPDYLDPRGRVIELEFRKMF